MRIRTRRTTFLAALAAAAAVAPVTAAQAEEPPAWADHEVVVSGLDNPRQLSWDGRGELYIAEAGHGGSECMGEDCVGYTGAISKVKKPARTNDSMPNRVITGLASGAGPDGSFATGADGVSAIKSRVWVAMTSAPPDAVPPGYGDQLGKLLSGHGSSGRYKAVGDIAGHEAANDPDGQGVESNPYAVLAQGSRTLVADAAGNTVVSVAPGGATSTFAVLPTITDGVCGEPADNNQDGSIDEGDWNEDGRFSCDPVPTSLALGPDGDVYVGGLASEAPDQGRVWRLDGTTGAIEQTWSGLTTVTGVAVGADGTVYASELFKGVDFATFTPGGQVTRISPSGMRSSAAVPFPAGVVVAPTGAVYVSAWSVAPATGLFGPGSGTEGAVWRLQQSAFMSPMT